MQSSQAVGDASTLDDVKEYYGKTLASKEDLKTNACTISSNSMPKHVRQALAMVHEAVTSKYYGCGLVAPESLENTCVLDLGSGSGQDCYVLSRLVGPQGCVVGIDMTDEQLGTAREYIEYHTEKFGYQKPNVSFVKGYIEKLGEAGLKDDTYDIIISNCVVNLSPDKKAVLREAYRVLKTGGELYFSDVYADSDLPDHIRKHKVLWGECVAGALYWKDLVSLAKELGFSTPRLVEATKMDLHNEELQKVVGDAKFVSATYRLFKLPAERGPSLKATYDGGITALPDKLKLDRTTTFHTGKGVCVDAELADILKCSRFNTNFSLEATDEKPSTQPLQDADGDPFKASASSPASSGCCSK